MLFYNKWSLSDELDERVKSQFLSLESVFSLQRPIISLGKQSEVFSLSVEGQTFYIKRYFKTKGLGSWLGLSRYHLELKNQRWFRQIGLQAAEVVGFGEKSLCLKPLRAAIILRGVPDTDDLMALKMQQPQLFADKRWYEAVSVQLAAIVAELHRRRFCHNDFHWRNVLVQRTDKGPQLFLIDCPKGMRYFGPVLTYRIIKDLACLDASARGFLSQTQRMRFYFLYRGIDRLTARDKSFLRKILHRDY
ncbi:lipopolysaccharide kinase (Kdo/WaaP) family protein [Sinobacterium caligoides]|uniref:Lipopolysaccharide kinase (Kdo/WaaP) family protein n=1 Tax=Sinobacterium caligoides TaxID=933926 RepID=A0A3N2E120_9GAMM|nr:lipopolysaccharide kinase InaA family protein [Sinobacterium caligoides]ROS05811.1 lipopolysaccharide kinase (Kdo/WaaP) family protein [Sinobacterium caligoides]